MANISSYQARSLWCMQHWGPPSHLRKEQMEDGMTKLGIMLFPPTPATAGFAGRGHFTYATNGMSERRMPCREEPHASPEFRIELVAYTRSEAPWVSDLLLEMARYPFLHGSGFAIGHTLPVQVSARDLWSGYLLSKPRLESETFNPMPIDIGIGEDWTFYAQVFGLLEHELEEAIDLGGPAFEALHLPHTLPEETSFLDIRRRPVRTG